VPRSPIALGLAIVVAAVVLVCPRLGHRPIVGSHEAVFPLVARDIVQRSAWMSAELRGVSYRNKPPLYAWAVAVASWPGGRVTPASAQLPAALAAIATAVATFVLGARLFGPLVGARAAVILLTSILFFDQALATIPDMAMVGFGLLAAVALWSIGNGARRRALLTFYLALALGVFTKGVPGLLPLAVAVVWLGTGGERAVLRRLAWTPGVIVFVVATALWLVPYLAKAGHDVAHDAAVRDWVNAVGVVQPGVLGVQATRAVLAFLPWTLVFPPAVAAAWRARHERAIGFVMCWLVVHAVLVFAMQQQRGRYLLPLLPGAALLVAWWAERETARRRPRPVLAALSLAGAVVGAAVIAVVADRLGITAVAAWWQTALVLSGIVMVGGIAWLGLRAGRLAATISAVAAATAVLLASGGWIVDEWRTHTWDYRRAAEALRPTSRPLAVAALDDDHQLLQVDFQLGRALRPLRSPEAVARHLAEAGGAVVIETGQWKTASRWLPLDPQSVCARGVGAEVVVVTHGKC
jgi:4-amino-4-deoxy-L-arabinose transferase-like glycosyltransferase